MARHRDLASLRHDDPLVLADAGDAPALHSLSDLVDGSLRTMAASRTGGAAWRRQVLDLEQHIRAAVAGGAGGTLSALWAAAAEARLRETEPAGRADLAEAFEQARRALAVDGAVVGCSARSPGEVIGHLWRRHEARRRARLAGRIERLVVALRELLRADELGRPEARTADALRRSFGPDAARLLDFDALARTLGGPGRTLRLSERRRRRVRAALEVLVEQRFAPIPGAEHEAYACAFAGCRAAFQAIATRVPEIAAVVRAMAIAELELDNAYVDAVHDAQFEHFDSDRLTPADLAWFPAYLVTVPDAGNPGERSAVLDLLTAGLPVKIVVPFDDILEDLPLVRGRLAFGRRRPQFAGMAMGLHSAFVLQAGAAYLYRMRDAIQRGVSIPGPALFCVYTGAGPHTGAFPPYLVSAAAVESRAFPLFRYDPTAGPDWASRFDLSANPQPEADWPRHAFAYEGGAHERRVETLGFTFADFAACDERYAGRLCRPATRTASGDIVPMAAFLAQPDSAGAQPGVPTVDEHLQLHWRVAGEELVLATRRCADTWRSLQELAGIGNSHAQRLLEAERAKWESARAGGAAVTAPAAAATAAPVEAQAAEPAPAPPAVPDDGAAYIETPRCTTCEECIRINERMFAYDGNKQAYIADPAAGTYRELVEAAESCQVSIIHPGKPRDSGEPDLEALMRRAAPFQ